MATTTANYNFTKIELTDSPPDITVLNGNFDTIDSALHGVSSQLGGLRFMWTRRAYCTSFMTTENRRGKKDGNTKYFGSR